MGYKNAVQRGTRFKNKGCNFGMGDHPKEDVWRDLPSHQREHDVRCLQRLPDPPPWRMKVPGESAD